uniref:Uncharacterized protein n=1 Tax=Anguilla anguilla TaxID=7936 RepID=A0A0E9QDF5_ANGAN
MSSIKLDNGCCLKHEGMQVEMMNTALGVV